MSVTLHVNETFVFRDEWKSFTPHENSLALEHGFNALLINRQVSCVPTQSGYEEEKQRILDESAKLLELKNAQLQRASDEYRLLQAQAQDQIHQTKQQAQDQIHQIKQQMQQHIQQQIQQHVDEEKRNNDKLYSAKLEGMTLSMNAMVSKNLSQTQETIRTYQQSMQELTNQISHLEEQLRMQQQLIKENENAMSGDVIDAEIKQREQAMQLENETVRRRMYEETEALRRRIYEENEAARQRLQEEYTSRLSLTTEQHNKTVQLLQSQVEANAALADKSKCVSRLQASVDEKLDDFAETLEPLKAMLSTNKGKGAFGEDRVEEIISEHFPAADISDSSKRGKSGDRMFILDGLTFIVEIKNTAKISTVLINEFLEVVNRRQGEVDCCIMASLRAPFPGKGRLKIEIIDRCVVGYVQIVDENVLVCLVEVMKQYSRLCKEMTSLRDSNESMYVSIVGGITEFINGSLDDLTATADTFVKLRRMTKELLAQVEDGEKRVVQIKDKIGSFLSKFSQIKVKENSFVPPTFRMDELVKIRDMKGKRTITAICKLLKRDKTYLKERGKLKDILAIADKIKGKVDSTSSGSDSDSDSD